VTSVFEFAKGIPAQKSGSEPRTGLAKQIPVASRSSRVWLKEEFGLACVAGPSYTLRALLLDVCCVLSCLRSLEDYHQSLGSRRNLEGMPK
jgi:hypothetical protein